MAKNNKISAKIADAKPKNCSDSYKILLGDELGQFCKAHGMSKVRATEQPIRQYMDKMNKALKNVK